MIKLKMYKKSIYKSLICFILSLIAFITGILMVLFYEDSGNYSTLFFLPLGFGVINFFTLKLYKHIFKSKVIIILIFGYFIKMVISPFTFALGGYNSFFNSYVALGECSKAVLFIIYEYLIIMGFACLYYGDRKQLNSIKVNCIDHKSKQFFKIVILLCLFLIIAYNYIPAIKGIYYFITDISFKELASIRWDNETIVPRGSVQRYIYSLFMFLWPIVRYVLPTALIFRNYCKRGENTKSLILSSLCVLIPFILLGGDNLGPFIASMFALIVLMKLYDKKGKKIALIFGGVGTVLLITIVISKLTALHEWRGANGIVNFAQLLNAYFPGVDNVTVALNMEGDNKLNTLFYDIYSGIPFVGTIFGLEGESLNDLYVTFSNTGGQIVPWGCNIGYYTTYVMSPILSGLVVFYILHIENKSNRANNFWVYYIQMIFATYTAISMIIYSSQIYLRFIFNVIIPIYLIMLITKIRLKSKI